MNEKSVFYSIDQWLILKRSVEKVIKVTLGILWIITESVDIISLSI